MAASSTPVLDQLLALISSSVENVKAEYTRHGGDIPSLDSTDPHPLDSGQPSLEMKRAIRILEGACHQLTTTVASPYHAMVNHILSVTELGCLRVVTDAKVADYLKAAGPEGLPLFELAAKTGIDGGKLGRILRLLATKHIFREAAEDVFTNNRLSVLLVSDNEMSSAVSFITDECLLADHRLCETLTDSKLGVSFLPGDAAVTRVYNMSEGKTLFSWYNTKEPARATRFGRAMVGFGKTVTGSFTTAYPWHELPNGSCVVDIGGGLGQASMDLMRFHSHLKFIVQDFSQTLSKGREMWQKTYPEGIDRVRFVPIDFLKESPVAGCDIYYLRHIIHDWEDEDCTRILQGIRKAMKHSSKVLVQDHTLHHIHRVKDQHAIFTQAPEPLLPNYGQGNIRPYATDIIMMSMLNAKERTLDEFIKLGEKAGLTFSGIFDTGETSIIEYEMAH